LPECITTHVYPPEAGIFYPRFRPVDLASLLTGIALVEYIFNWPGIGWQAVQAAQRLDIPMVMGSVLLGALLIGIANLMVDLLNTWLDPRVRVSQ
jgi:peptide/nickel transport system permease protein